MDDEKPAGRTPLILIVDDIQDLRLLLSLMLKNFDTIEARNGKEAIEIFKKHRPDVVLMDIVMPVLDGIEATKRIMELDKNAKILALSAFSELKGKEMLEAGARELINKPVTQQELLSVIKKYINS